MTYSRVARPLFLSTTLIDKNYKRLLEIGSGLVCIGYSFLTPPTAVEGVNEFQHLFAHKHSIFELEVLLTLALVS